MRKLRNSENQDQNLLNNPRLQENPFSVPKDYFHDLTSSIIRKKNIIESTDEAWSVPQNYQEELMNDILLKVSEEKLKSKINTDGFTVPANYFNQLQSSILDKTSKEEILNDGQIVPFKRSQYRSWIKYVSAACITLAISAVAFFQLNEQEPEPETTQVEDIINEIRADEIISYLAFYSETGDYLILSEELAEESDDFEDSFSTEEIESYLENSI
ncbi:hypothetical protein [Albibacterium profundi]|uniref:Anti sigma-E protein RseA N-terminal domain-containing protein n=1 Tax=Albibacterium profundi TaxID=3134906 RepID=A0ABV5CFF2_9SPHI